MQELEISTTTMRGLVWVFVGLTLFGCELKSVKISDSDGAMAGSPGMKGDDGGMPDVTAGKDAASAPDLASATGGAGGSQVPAATAGTTGTTGTTGSAGASPGGTGGTGGAMATGGTSAGGGGGAGGRRGTGGSPDMAGTSGSQNTCEKGGPPCFEPCGGAPYGIWQLEDSCFKPTSTKKGSCEIVAHGTPGKNDLTMQILDNGSFIVVGSEDWSIDATMSLACRGLTSIDQCSSAAMVSDALLFSYTNPTACAPNACGACQCAEQNLRGPATFKMGPVDPKFAGTYLQIGPHQVPYCVQGDVLWLGGASPDGPPTVSYKFRKRSCRGTTTPCAARTPAQCPLGLGCWLGVCAATTPAMAATCAANDEIACGLVRGCTWRPNVCAGQPEPTCGFRDCGVQPGCTWGEPLETCAGDSNCDARPVSQCAGAGCSIHQCLGLGIDQVDCQTILNAADCAKAPGCVPHPGSGTRACTGQTLCSAQIDTSVCGQLNCFAQPYCAGTTTPCSELSLAACSSMFGCYHQW